LLRSDGNLIRATDRFYVTNCSDSFCRFIVLCYSLLYCVTVYFIVLQFIVLCYSLLYCVTVYCIVLQFILLCYSLLYRVTVYYIVLVCKIGKVRVPRVFDKGDQEYIYIEEQRSHSRMEKIT
jgi:hypothetical protein